MNSTPSPSRRRRTTRESWPCASASMPRSRRSNAGAGSTPPITTTTASSCASWCRPASACSNSAAAAGTCCRRCSRPMASASTSARRPSSGRSCSIPHLDFVLGDVEDRHAARDRGPVRLDHLRRRRRRPRGHRWRASAVRPLARLDPADRRLLFPSVGADPKFAEIVGLRNKLPHHN